jgi:chemotaxis protein MotB
MARATQPDDGANPYIAFADLTLNLVFVLVFFVAAVLAVGQTGWDQVKYRNAQEDVLNAIRRASLTERPVVLDANLRNDPPGAQRWAFSSRRTKLFQGNTARLTATGERNLLAFARALAKVPEWRRIRIEGHTLPPRGKESEWDLSARRASVVADLFATRAGIPPYRLAVAARGNQTPFNGSGASRSDPANERVEIVVEYAQNLEGR